MTFRELFEEKITLDLRLISMLLVYKKDFKYNEKYNDVTSNLALRDLISKVEKYLKVKFKKEEPQDSEYDLYTIGNNIEVLASETGKLSRLQFIKKK